MNGVLVVLGMVVASIVVAGVVVYRISSFYDLDGRSHSEYTVRDQSSLDEDLRDILGFVPLDEVDAILQSFIKYDKQIGDLTVGYINDNAKYIAGEFKQMPEFQWFLSFLANNGLDLEYWRSQIAKYWKDIPKYIETDASVACGGGGLAEMVFKIVETIPCEELHELLRQKVRYSASFRGLVEALRSPRFEELCEAIEESKVLQRHYFWANDDGIELMFGMELMKSIYTYLAHELH